MPLATAQLLPACEGIFTSLGGETHLAVVVKAVVGSHFGVGEFTTHFRTYFSGDWDVHWGYGLLTPGHLYASIHHTSASVENRQRLALPSFPCLLLAWTSPPHLRTLWEKAPAEMSETCARPDPDACPPNPLNHLKLWMPWVLYGRQRTHCLEARTVVASRLPLACRKNCWVRSASAPLSGFSSARTSSPAKRQAASTWCKQAC